MGTFFSILGSIGILSFIFFMGIVFCIGLACTLLKLAIDFILKIFK